MEAMVLCCAFWFKILSNPLYEGGGILRVAAMEAMERGGTLIMKLQECFKSFGWCSVGAEEARSLYPEIKVMLETCAKRLTKDEWMSELSTKPKLATLRLLKEKGIGHDAWL